MFSTFGALELEFTIGYFPSKKVVAVLWSTEMIYWQGQKLGLPANNAVKRPNCARTAEESKEEKKKVVKSKCKHEARSWPRRKGPDSAMKEKEIEKAMERRRRRRRARKEQPDNE